MLIAAPQLKASVRRLPFAEHSMIDPESQASELYRQAREQMAQNQLVAAVSLFQQSIALSPHFKALELLGECFIRLNRLAEAIVPLAAATTLNKGVRGPIFIGRCFPEVERLLQRE
jgi:Flp pilus assembly protein TadD